MYGECYSVVLCRAIVVVFTRRLPKVFISEWVQIWHIVLFGGVILCCSLSVICFNILFNSVI